MEKMDESKDKKRIIIEHLLQAFKDGLTIQEIIDKTGMARHTVLARLHRLEGEQKVRMRQVNMAKMYYWNETSAEENIKNISHQLHQETKIIPLKEEHITLKNHVLRKETPPPKKKMISKVLKSKSSKSFTSET